MTTRAELRASLRLTLEDSAGANHLWDDATLNEALRTAVRAYGTAHPVQLSTSLSVSAGASQYALPAVILDGRDLVALLDDQSREVPHNPSPPPDSLGSFRALSWRTWGNQLYLSAAPSAAATWSILYLSPRVLIEDDVTAQPIAPGDESIIDAEAAAIALETRAAAELKRGQTRNAAGFRLLAEQLHARADQLATKRTRTVRVGSL